LADKFGLPVVSFVDTAGAYPGIGAEERGQAEAIARSARTQPRRSACRTSAVIIGEGGSGGAIAIATANKVLMLEHSIYSVISPRAPPRSSGAIAPEAQDAATNMKITAQDLMRARGDRRYRQGAGRRVSFAACRLRTRPQPGDSIEAWARRERYAALGATGAHSRGPTWSCLRITVVTRPKR
jgi:hypothetical protein